MSKQVLRIVLEIDLTDEELQEVDGMSDEDFDNFAVDTIIGLSDVTNHITLMEIGDEVPVPLVVHAP